MVATVDLQFLFSNQSIIMSSMRDSWKKRLTQFEGLGVSNNSKSAKIRKNGQRLVTIKLYYNVWSALPQLLHAKAFIIILSYHELFAFFSFRISLVAHWLRVLVLLFLDLRPWVRRSEMGSTSKRPIMLAPKAAQRSLKNNVKWCYQIQKHWKSQNSRYIIVFLLQTLRIMKNKMFCMEREFAEVSFSNC